MEETLEKFPDYIFNISPGLELRNAFITEEDISPDESVFSARQLAIFDKILNAEIERLESEHTEKLEKETKAAWESGNEAGITQTRNEMLSVVNELTESFQKVIASITYQTETLLEYHEQEILKLILAIARKVIDVEVTLNPEIILSTLKRSLEYLNEKEEIKILVNPTDWSVVRENLAKLSLTIDMPQNIEVVANENIESGSCRIDFRAGSIDADLETQFAEIKRKLLKNTDV